MSTLSARLAAPSVSSPPTSQSSTFPSPPHPDLAERSKVLEKFTSAGICEPSAKSETELRVEFVVKHLGLVQNRIEAICRRHRLSVDEDEEFRSVAIVKLLEKSERLERLYEGRANLRGYFDSVLENLLRDYRTSKWGKWRASAAAQRLGTQAVTLERLIHRDRLAAPEAVRILAERSAPWQRRSVVEIEEELWHLVADLPARVDRRAVVDSDSLQERLPDELAAARLELVETIDELSSLTRALIAALSDLPKNQRTVLRLRFVDGLSYAEIEERTGVRTPTLYRQIARTLRKLRRLMGERGVDADTALRAEASSSGRFSVERLFAAVGT